MAQQSEPEQKKRPHKRAFNSGIFLTGLAFAFGLWSITGALAYNDRKYQTASTHDSGVVLAVVVIPFMFLMINGNTIPEYELLASPPRKASGWAITAVLTLSTGASIAFCIATAGSRRLLEHAFLILTVAYASALVEAGTGLVSRLSRWLESMAV